MQELVGVYAARRLDQPGVTTSPDAVSVYREDEKGVINDIVDNDSLKLQYFVLHRPLTRGKSVEEKHKAKKGHGLITQYAGLVEHDRRRDCRHGHLAKWRRRRGGGERRERLGRRQRHAGDRAGSGRRLRRRRR